MDITRAQEGRGSEIADLFEATFTASEGAEEGRAVGALARDLLTGTPPADLRVFVAEEAGQLVGAAIFTRLVCAQDPRMLMLLSPMAVLPDRQRSGVGQTLLRAALRSLGAEGVEIAVTYGDPAYYGRVGFAPVAPTLIPPPQPLSMPEGWLALSLSGGPIASFGGPLHCAAALDDPAFW